MGNLQYSDRCERSRNEGAYCAMSMETRSVMSVEWVKYKCELDVCT